MGNRSKFIAVTSAAAGVAGMRSLAKRRRRARLRRAAEGIGETLMPSVAEGMPSALPLPAGDEAHAPGHRHLSTAAIDDEPTPPPVRQRPFAKHRRGLRHPGKG
jgi:hypothetical protein